MEGLDVPRRARNRFGFGVCSAGFYAAKPRFDPPSLEKVEGCDQERRGDSLGSVKIDMLSTTGRALPDGSGVGSRDVKIHAPESRISF